MFRPNFQILPSIAKALMQIEGSKRAIDSLPITVRMQANLRETARLHSTHYSTQIEGNRLNLKQAEQVLNKKERFPGRERDEKEVLGYYQALAQVEKDATLKKPITETSIKTLHALLMAGGKKLVKPTSYRKGQNVIKDSATGKIVYLPPEAKDVPKLMKELIEWLRIEKDLPCPIQAGIAHYQIATIHPYFDGNGRLARLLATLILHLGGYDLKGFFSLEEYYARKLQDYYQAIAVGPSHNYYEGRSQADVSKWLEYFIQGMATAFEKVEKRAKKEASLGKADQSTSLRKLDPRQRKVLSLFKKSEMIIASQVGRLFSLAPRSARLLCQRWTKEGFFVVADPAKKSRKYRLSPQWESLISKF